MKKATNTSAGVFAFTYLFLSLQSGLAIADDTEIYLTRDLPADQRVRPNIMFVIDTSGSMQSGVPGTDCKALTPVYNTSSGMPIDWCTSTEGRANRTNNGQLTRLQVVKQVVNQLVDELATSNDSNIGLARYDSNSNGGFINVPVKQAGTIASTFKSQLSSYYASGATPLLETYHEAARYMRGETPLYGNNSRGYIEKPSDRTTNQLINPWKSDSTAYTGASYKSPIENSCQKSNIIVLTDGLPNGDVGSNATIAALTSGKNTQYTSCNRNYPTDGAAADGCWMPGLSEYLANQDNSPATGKQYINTYTVGFGNIGNSQLLQDTADYGGGKFFTTSNTSGLVTALKSIVVDILAENTTFTTPTVSVSAYSNFGYRNDLFYALFRPADGARWVGNIKKYKAITDNSTGDLVVTDALGNNAVDPTTGFFNDSAQSFWSPSADGKNAERGGAASKLTSPSTRKMYTYTGSDRLAGSGMTTSVDLTSTSHALSSSNTAVTKAMLGDSAMTDTYKANLLSWARGTDPTTNTARLQIADVLHNAPKVVAYISDEDLERVAAGTNQDSMVLFYGTNEGHIGALDPKTGNELFAFIPKEILPNLKAYYDDPKGSQNKKYGIDGQFGLKVTYGAINTTTKLRPVSEVLLYAGMGRGGRNYYALDVSPTTSGAPSTIQPKLKWTIKGGTVGTAYQRLGQTWSTPKVSKIKWNGVTKDVLIFTGGYDVNQDDDTPNTPNNDTYGNALYIADASTGERLWMAGPPPTSGETAAANLQISDMTNSMPADPTLVDISGDGLIDTIFTADTRGQIFRFDINNTNTTASNFAKGGRIAQFGGSTAQNNRRFYNQPDIALIKERGGKSYYTIAIGSGYRGHPLNEDTIDRFYVVRDPNIYSAPTTYTTVTESNLIDVSSVELNGTAATAIQTQIDAKRAQIDALTLAESNARKALSDYQGSVGYASKQDQLLQTNNEINLKQAAIETILKADPYIVEHATESDARTQLNNLIVSTLNGLEQLSSFIAPATHTNTGSFLSTELSNSNTADWGLLQTNLQALNASTDDTQYQSVLTAEQALSDAIQSGVADTTTQQTALNDARTAYEATSAYTQRQTLLENQQAINSKLTSILNLQTTIFNALNANDSANVTSATGQLSTLKSELNTLITGLTDQGSADNDELLAGKTTTKQNQVDSEAISSPLVSQASLLNNLQTEKLALSGLASTLQSELVALSDAAYNTSSNVLTSVQISAATAADTTPPLSMFDAYNYLIELQRATAVAEIPTLRTEINDLYAQLTPGNSYIPDLAALNNSKGWFIRFPLGEKVLSSSISYKGALLFSTFRPSGQQVTTCGPDVGRGRFYALSLVDASAVFTQTIAGVTTDKRSFDLIHGGIPPKPAVVLREDGIPGLLCGAEQCDKDNNGTPTECKAGIGFCESGTPVSSTYWREN